MPFLWAARNPFSAPTVTPLFPEITITALPAARMPSLMPPEKSNRPGVSSRFILVSFHSTGSRARDTEALRRISSGSKSHTVLPSETFPSPSDLPGQKEGGFSQRGLSRTGVAHQGDIADVFGAVLFHV